MRLIDADKLKHDVLDWQDCYNGFSDTYDKSMIIDEIDAQPTVKTEPVVHGKWIYTGFMEVKCSNCGNVFHELEDTNYCPSCGCKMDMVEVEK